MKACAFIALALAASAIAGPYAPKVGQPGSTAVTRTDSRIVAWGSAVGELLRGPQDISDDSLGDVTWGAITNALGLADAQTDSLPVVSLGDGGSITLLFPLPITDGAGADFAVFENSITDGFLELGFVEVSSDGIHFIRFPAASLTQTATQVDSFDSIDTTNVHNLAGKYRRGFGTPFDLSEIAMSPFLDVLRVTHVRVVDVVGSIDPVFASRDALNRIINDPWPTPFETGGFDLDAIAVLHQIPEPGSAMLLAAGAIVLSRGRRRNPKLEIRNPKE